MATTEADSTLAGGPSRLFVSCDNQIYRAGNSRAGINGPLVTMHSYSVSPSLADKSEEIPIAWERPPKEWKTLQNDPSSLLMYEEGKRKYGFMPLVNGWHRFHMILEGSGTQPIGVLYYGPRAMVQYKGYGDGPSADCVRLISYTLPPSNNRKWLRTADALRPCRSATFTVHVPDTTQIKRGLYLFFVFAATPEKLFDRGATSSYYHSEPLLPPLAPGEPTLIVQGETEDTVADKLWKAREETGNLILITEQDNREFTVHSAVLSTCSEFFKAALHSRFMETGRYRMDVRGNEMTWTMMIEYAYKGTSKLLEEMQSPKKRSVMNMDDIKFILYTVNYYQFDGLKETVRHWFEDNLNKTNVLGLVKFAWIHSDALLLQLAIEYITSVSRCILLSSDADDLAWIAHLMQMKEENLEFGKALAQEPFEFSVIEMW